MIRYVTRKELKERTPEVLALMHNEGKVIVTYKGKPEAVLSEFTEDVLEDYVFAHSIKFKKFLAEVEKQIKAGKHSDFREFLQEQGIEIDV